MEPPKSSKNKNVRRKGNLQILGNIESRHKQTRGDERKIFKKYLRRTRKLLETKLYSKNIIKRINTWAVRYSGPFSKWTREDLKQRDQITRKVMTMHKALYPRHGDDRLYVSIKVGERELTSIDDSSNVSIQWPEDYTEKRERGLISTTRNNSVNARINRSKIT